VVRFKVGDALKDAEKLSDLESEDEEDDEEEFAEPERPTKRQK
jgi:hypothetical protein